MYTSRRQPHSLSLAKDMKLGFNTVTTGNRTPDRRVAVHYTTVAPRQLHKKFNTQSELRYRDTVRKMSI